MKYNFDDTKYVEMVKQCNENPQKYIIVDTGETFKIQEIVYDLNEEKTTKLKFLYYQYKTELNNILDPTELQPFTMMVADTDESIDFIEKDGTPKQYTQDELTELLNSELQKRNELLLKYKTLYNKVENAKKVETVHEVKW